MTIPPLNNANPGVVRPSDKIVLMRDDIPYSQFAGKWQHDTSDISATPGPDYVAADSFSFTQNWTPSGNTSATFKTPVLIKQTVTVGSGKNVNSPAHPVGAYILNKYQGAGTIDLTFGVESKLIMPDSGTTVNKHSAFKPAIDELRGILSNYYAFDGDIDFSAANVTGTIGQKFILYSPRSDLLLYQRGGIVSNSKFILSNYVLKASDSMCTLMNLGGGAITVTADSTLTNGFMCWIAQGGSGDTCQIIASGGNTIFNADNQFKTGAALALCQVNVISSGAGGAVIFAGNKTQA